jgi:hypothetical protein
VCVFILPVGVVFVVVVCALGLILVPAYYYYNEVAIVFDSSLRNKRSAYYTVLTKQESTGRFIVKNGRSETSVRSMSGGFLSSQATSLTQRARSESVRSGVDSEVGQHHSNSSRIGDDESQIQAAISALSITGNDESKEQQGLTLTRIVAQGPVGDIIGGRNQDDDYNYNDVGAAAAGGGDPLSGDSVDSDEDSQGRQRGQIDETAPSVNFTESDIDRILGPFYSTIPVNSSSIPDLEPNSKFLHLYSLFSYCHLSPT